MGLLCRIANDTARNSPAAPQARRQTVEKGKEAKEESGEKLAVAKPCIFAQQSASHAANAAKKGWRLRPQARVGAVRSLPCGQPR